MNKFILLIVLLLTGCSVKNVTTTNQLSNLEFPNEVYESLDANTINKIITYNVNFYDYIKYSTHENFKIESLNEYLKYEEKNGEKNTQLIINIVNNPEFFNPSYNNIKPALFTNSIKILVNKTYYLDKNYVPSNLVLVPNKYVILEDRNIYISNDAYLNFLKLYKDSIKYNYNLKIFSGYRSYQYQSVAYEASGFDDNVSARPGHSEHQTGYAIDISTSYYGLTENLGESIIGKYLKDNSYKFGFIIRYPKNKEQLTGFFYEPWHLRYVGIGIATIIHNEKITYEEYLLKNEIIP